MQDLPSDESWITDQRRAIGERIREERLRQNRTQDEVWTAAGVNRWTYQRAEYGEEVQVSTLLRILWVLDITFTLPLTRK
ncbi:helix-turn-helix transcriptional regulator [Streptomyces aquilus]|uniref:helix-turn-helix transcriptional regulator n=1 Tax=Streptomyces aquilus TaxID=2548456 RepID=UPI0037D6F653